MAKDPEELQLKFIGLTLSARGRVAVFLMAVPAGGLLLAVAWRIVMG